jgi:hypothetical protein
MCPSCMFYVLYYYLLYYYVLYYYVLYYCVLYYYTNRGGEESALTSMCPSLISNAKKNF